MNYHDIRYYIEPGQLPARPGVAARVLRGFHLVKSWSQSIALLGIGACCGALVAILLLR
jgi:hypothetical protein